MLSMEQTGSLFLLTYYKKKSLKHFRVFYVDARSWRH